MGKSRERKARKEIIVLVRGREEKQKKYGILEYEGIPFKYLIIIFYQCFH